MSEEFGLTNSGDKVVQVPVEKKEPNLVPIVKKDVTQTAEEFVKNIPPVIEKKKRGRPKKVATVVKATAPVVVEPAKPEPRTWHCSSCQEDFNDKNVMKIGAGTNRWAVFCPQCQRSFGFQDQEVLNKVAALIKNNPTGK